MPEYTGQITEVAAPLVPLGLIPLLPLVGALLAAALGPRMQRAGVGRGLARRLRLGSSGVTLIGVGASVAALALALAQLVAMEEQAVVDVAWRMARIGSLDVSLSFSMDPVTAALAVGVAVASAIGHGVVARGQAPAKGEPAATYPWLSAALGVLSGAALLLVLADNLAVMLFGWEGVALGAALALALSRRAPADSGVGVRAFVVHRAGDAALLVGAALLFWGLGGTWLSDGRYLPDYRARFVAVAMGGAGAAEAREGGGADPRKRTSIAELRARAGARGYLTFTGHPGARVFLGVADRAQLAATPEPFAVSPFIRKEIPVGAHSIVIIPGDGATVSGDGFEVAAIDRISVERGQEVAIVTLGPTLTFREIRDQLAIKDAGGARFLREALDERRAPGGIGLIPLACALLLLGAAVKGAQAPLCAWRSSEGQAAVAWVAAAAAALAGVVLVLRLEPVFDRGPVGSGVAMVALLVLPFCGAAAARALARRTAPREGGAS